MRGRLYPWGIVEGAFRCPVPLNVQSGHDQTLPIAVFLPSVENQSHCDFVKLRNMLICSHMHDLKDVTCDIHYENYRAQCIQEMTRYLRPESETASSGVYPPSTSPFLSLSVLSSKLAEDNHMESPVAILPLPANDGEIEKRIRNKDKEVRSNFFCFQLIFNTSVDLCVFVLN